MAEGLPRQLRRFAFVSSNSGWGGSEELWSAAAAELASRGHVVHAMKSAVDLNEPRVARLQALGARLTDLRRVPLVPERLTGLGVTFSWPVDYLIRALRLRAAISRARPDLVILSQGGNIDGLFLGKRLMRRGVPYVLIVQKAAEMYWPADVQIGELRRLYAGARRCYFVSEHNLRLTEEQLAMPLPTGRVVRNPFMVPWDAPAPWPDETAGWRLACVGRLFPREKGQDILLRVLARDKWKRRPVSLSLFGAGDHLESLKATAAFLGLERVTFHGFTRDVPAIWRDHHALVLPSHCEGLPLVLVEAMLSGRVPVVTDVAGNAELVEDGASGFLAAAPTDAAVDDALERAWQARHAWASIGAAAARRARALVPPDPAALLAADLAALVDEPVPENLVSAGRRQAA